MYPQEQVMALAVPRRIECVAGSRLSRRYLHRVNPLMEHLTPLSLERRSRSFKTGRLGVSLRVGISTRALWMGRRVLRTARRTHTSPSAPQERTLTRQVRNLWRSCAAAIGSYAAAAGQSSNGHTRLARPPGLSAPPRPPAEGATAPVRHLGSAEPTRLYRSCAWPGSRLSTSIMSGLSSSCREPGAVSLGRLVEQPFPERLDF